MVVDLDSERFHTLLERICGRLTLVLGQHNAADIESDLGEHVEKAHNIDIIGDTEVAAYLVFFDVARVYHDDDLGIVLELEEHLELAVGLEAGQYSRCVIVVKELSAELEIELVAKLRNALSDVLRLHFEVSFIVKSDFIHSFNFFHAF